MNAPNFLNKITRIRQRQAKLLAALKSIGETALSERLHWCASWLHFREWSYSGETRLMNANFCKRYLLCPACASRRAGRLVQGYLPKIEQVTKERPELRACMITLTLKNGHDLQERFDLIRDAWKAMSAHTRKAKQAKYRHDSIEWNKVEGSIRSIETTRNEKDGSWHVHMHCFALISDWIDRVKLAKEWERFTGDSFIVDVRLCKPNPKRPDACPVKEGLTEVLKYACKFAGMPPSDLIAFYRVAKESRLVDPSGCLRGINVGDIETDPDIDTLTGPFMDYIASWMPGQTTYQIRDVPAEAPPMIVERPGHAPRVMGNGSAPVMSRAAASRLVALSSLGKLKAFQIHNPAETSNEL